MTSRLDKAAVTAGPDLSIVIDAEGFVVRADGRRVSFGLWMKVAREAGGATQTAVAQLVGVTAYTVYRWERCIRPVPSHRHKAIQAAIISASKRTVARRERDRANAQAAIDALVDHCISSYGRPDALKWPSDMLVDISRALARYRQAGVIPFPRDH